MGILVFLPEFDGDVQAEMKARGLGDLLEPGIDPIPVRTSKGPTGGPGMFVTFHTHSPREYSPDPKAQTWLEATKDGDRAAGRYWVGYANNAKPGPEALQRRELIDGEAVALADDRVWIVPCCEHAPKRITRNRDGKECEIVRDDYRQWVEKSNEIFGLIMAQGYDAATNTEYAITIPGGLRYAALSLRNNYRVNADVVDLLALIDNRVISDVILAACGITALASLIRQKKNNDTPCPC